MPTPTLNEMMAAYAEDAVGFARAKFGVSLNYANDSIQAVESVAEKLFQAQPKGVVGKLFRKAPSEEEIQTVCKMLGGYIGEVYRRSKGGNWAINEEFQALGISHGENWIFPPSKVHKRLTNGAEDNLWSYFSVLVQEPWTRNDANPSIERTRKGKARYARSSFSASRALPLRVLSCQTLSAS